MWFFALLAVFNVALGFAAGVALGHRWRRLMATGWTPAPSTVGAPTISSPTTVKPSVEASRPSVATEAEQPVAEAADNNTIAKLLPPEAEPLIDCRAGVRRYQERLDQTEQHLRDENNPWDAAAIESCLESLRAATEEFLLERNQSQPKLTELTGTLGPAGAPMAAQIDSALKHQDEIIQQAYEAFQTFDAEAEIAPQRELIAKQAGRLIDGGIELDAALQGLECELLRNSAPEVKPEKHPRDEHTGLLTRAAMEAAVLDFWRRDPHRMRTLVVALMDVDQTATLNQAHGHRRTDAALRAWGRMLQAKSSPDLVAARYSGQSFALLFFDGDLRSAVNTVEQLRQGLELTQFVDGDRSIRLTVSCGVTPATPADTLLSLRERLEATVHEAKRYGRNRTFLNEGKHPAPVIPPNFALEECRVPI